MLAVRLAPVSESYLRKLVRSCGLPLDPVVEGVRQDSLKELERTLLALAAEYLAARETGNEVLALHCRRVVMIGKEHARLAARHAGASADEQRRKDEMASWMLLWLENPELFPSWLALRKQAGGLPP